MFQLLLGDPKAFPGQLGDIIPPAGSGTSEGLLPYGRSLNIQEETPRRHPD